MNPKDALDYAADMGLTIHDVVELLRLAGNEFREDESVPVGQSAWEFYVR